jgi:hypothetical protein
MRRVRARAPVCSAFAAAAGVDGALKLVEAEKVEQLGERRPGAKGVDEGLCG